MVLPDYAIADGKSEAGTAADLLCGKEGFKDLRKVHGDIVVVKIRDTGVGIEATCITMLIFTETRR